MKRQSIETEPVKIPLLYLKLELACFVFEAGVRYCEMEMPGNIFK